MNRNRMNAGISIFLWALAIMQIVFVFTHDAHFFVPFFCTVCAGFSTWITIRGWEKPGRS